MANFAAINLLVFSGIPSTENDSNNNITPLNDDALELAAYSETTEQTGNNIAITQHQSINNISDPLYEITTFDSLQNRSFEVECPADTDFNSSYTEIKVEDIYAPNVTRIIEDEVTGSSNFTGRRLVGSFNVYTDSYLVNFSTKLYRDGVPGEDSDIRVRIFNSTWLTDHNEPDTMIKLLIDDIGNIQIEDINDWYSNYSDYFDPHLLDPDNTDNNTFYIELYDTGDFTTYWRYKSDGGDPDDMNAYEWDQGNSEWDLITVPPETIDFTLKVDLAPVNNTPAPEDIGMEINGSKVSNGIDNSGTWTSNTALPSLNNQLNFTIDAGWWDVTCNITKIQVNYTKTSIYGIANFTATTTENTVYWNVTMSDLINDFEGKFENPYINFTIPTHWQSVEVWSGGTPKTISTTRPLGTGYNESQVLNAENGNFWFLKARTSNRISEIEGIRTYVNDINVDKINYTKTKTIEINATFSENIANDNGDFNLSVYNHDLPRYLNHTKDPTTFTGGTEINVNNWLVSDNVTEYGKFKVQILWNNGTDAGFREKNITILGETELVKIYPSSTFDATDTFNITVFYNDTGQDIPIKNADVTYRIGSGSWNTENITETENGYYNITLNCNNTDFSDSGQNTITVNANKQYYNNQSIPVNINILGETELILTKFPDISSYDSSEIFNITAFYNNTVRTKGINGASITVEIDGTPYDPIIIDPFGDGFYNITMNCSASEFGEYGPSTIRVNASKIYYYNTSTTIDVHIIGVSELTTSNYAPSYSSSDIFNITAYFNDTERLNKGITGATIEVDIDGTPYTPLLIDPFGDGYYNITVNCSAPEFGAYGDSNIRINASKIYYYNQSTIVSINIGAKTDATISIYPIKPFYSSSETFNITVFYNDTARNEGINGATIEVEIDTVDYTPILIDPYGEGYYNITINCNAVQFGDYGSSLIEVNISKPNFQSKYPDINVNIRGETELTIIKVPVSAFYSSSGTFNITAFLNDTARNQGINGSTIELYVGINPINQIYIFDNGDGYYNISINCNDTVFNTYGLFSIRVDANKTNYYNWSKFESAFIMGNTTLTLISPAQNSVRVGGTNIFTITVDYEDVELIAGVSGGFINYSINGQAFSGDIISWDDNADGTYDINIDIDDTDFGTDYGFIDIIINVSNYKYFNRSITLTIHRQIPTNIDPGNSRNFGNIFRSENRSFTFNYTDNLDNPILGASISNISSLEGFTWLLIVDGNGNYTISLNSTGVTDKTYNFQFRVNATGNQTQIIQIQFNVLKPNTKILDFTTNIVDLVVPFGFNLTLNFNFTDAFNNIGIDNIDTTDVSITHLGINWSQVVNETFGDFVNFPNGGWRLINHGNGNYTLNISTHLLTRGNLYSIFINISYFSINPGPYNSSVFNLDFYYASAQTTPSDGGGGGGGGGGSTTVTGIPFETLVLYIIVAAALVGTVGAIVGIQKGVIAPKKREKERILREVTTIFDDAINLEHVLVIYKTSGTCVFFKSYGIEEIDPELISGFLTAVSSFGREMDSQEALNEIQYGDKMLLLADGEFIRVALVLNKQASIILRQHLKEFIDFYEEKYASSLPNWRGQLADFRDSGELIDRVFSTSIILPHQVNYDAKKVKFLKSPHSKDVLKVANTLVTDSNKKYFFIATLLVEATDKTGKEKAEVFMGIKELRDTNILTPIEISAIEKPPITQQELELIKQQVSDLPGLAEEEIVDITNNLAQMGPAEREAYLASSREQAEVVSAPIKTKSETGLIDSEKTAKKEIKNLKKLANTALKRKDTQKAIEIYNNAAVIATNWDLTKEFEELEDVIRITTINDLKAKMKVLESEAKVAAKAGDYSEATQRYSLAARAASEILKLGITEMTKEVKRLTNKSKEYEKLS